MVAHAYNFSTWILSQVWGFHTSLRHTGGACHKKPEAH